MTDVEFDVLDELYFVQTFAALREALDTEIEEATLVSVLSALVQKGWVKCLRPSRDEPVDVAELDMEKEYQHYCYLATKAGLMAHNLEE